MAKKKTKTPKMRRGAVVFYEGTDALEAEQALLRTVEARVDSLRGAAMSNDWIAHLLSEAHTVADRVKVARLGIHHDDEAATQNVAALGSILGSLAPEGMEYSVTADGYGYTPLSSMGADPSPHEHQLAVASLFFGTRCPAPG